MYKFDNEVLESLSDDEMEKLLYSIRKNYTFYDDFKKGSLIKFRTSLMLMFVFLCLTKYHLNGSGVTQLVNIQ